MTNPTLESLKDSSRSIPTRLNGGARLAFTSADELLVIYRENWLDCPYEFRHNGVRIDEARALELVAGL